MVLSCLVQMSIGMDSLETASPRSAPIPRTAAYALGALFEHPKLTRQRLEAFAQP